MPWNDALAWTIMLLLSVLLAVMGWDTLKQTINDRKEKNDKESNNENQNGD